MSQKQSEVSMEQFESRIAVMALDYQFALAIAKASQAISGEIVLDKLAQTLVHTVLESAGAQRGALLLQIDGQLSLAAEGQTQDQERWVQFYAERKSFGANLPSSILKHVRDSGEKVLLADAAAPNQFSGDSYLLERRPKSILCLPIVRQAALIGILYLENSLVADAFPPQRIEALELLALQAAISLNNARLYRDLQQENIERKQAESGYRKTERLYRTLWETTTDAVVIFGLDQVIRYANPATLYIFGYRPEELEGQPLATIQPERLREGHRRGLQRYVETGVKRVNWRSAEAIGLRRDGQEIPIEIAFADIELEGERLFVGFIRDNTERKRVEEELKRHRTHLEELVAARTDELTRAKERADVANQAKSTFLSSMSHELRTPLNAVLGYAQILKRDKGLSERQTSGLNTIQQSGEHLLTLINDILDLAKIETGKFELYPTPFNLPLFLRTLGDIIRVKAEEKSLLFSFEMQADLPLVVQADEKRLRQVLLNLLSNAVKFTDRGQITLRVHCAPCWGEQARLHFEIQDTGIGIDLEQQALLFRPFIQVGDVQRRFGGTGLGLVISRQLVRLMGGDIQIDSQPGKGSRFWFEIAVPTAAELAAIPAAPAITGYHGPRKKVLIVDDVEANRAMLVDLLGGLGFDTAEAVNGQEGLEQAQTQTLAPDLIVMDMVMPVMDGQEATRRMRATPGLQAIPVIAVSASATPEDQAASLAAGANAFLPKPIEPANLLKQIGTLLNLDWQYEQPEAEAQEANEAALVVPPRQDLETLYQLALLGNMREIREWANQLVARDPCYGPFAGKLLDLAMRYQSKEILKLVDRHMKPDEKA